MLIIIHMQIKTTQTINFLFIFRTLGRAQKPDLSYAAKIICWLYLSITIRVLPSFRCGPIDVCYYSSIINSGFFPGASKKILNDGLKMIYKTLERCKFFYSAAKKKRTVCNYPCGFLLLFRPHADRIVYDCEACAKAHYISIS